MEADVIVVGGGFAGLSAATALAERGVRVLVLEERPSLGGRASSFTDPATGERVDNGQHVLVGGYHETFRFLRRVGADGGVRLQNGLSVDFVDRAGRRSRLRCPSLPAPLHLLAGAVRWGAIGWRDRAALALLGRPSPSRVDPALTVRQWLETRGQTPRLVELLWEPLAVAALNQSIDEASAVMFAAVLRRMFGRHSRDAALGLPLKALDEVYAAPSRGYVAERGGRVETSAKARVLVEGSRTAVRVGGDLLHPRAVIAAVAWYSLAALFEDAPPRLAGVVADAEATPARPIVTVNLWLDRPVTDGAFVGLPGRAMHWVFDKRALFGEHGSHLSLLSSAATSLVERSNEELVALAMDDLRAACPAARDASVRRAVAVRERRATFSVAPGLPPRPTTETGVPGLFLAGDWIDTGLPATIEGAVVSGHAAAKATLAHLSP